MHTYLSKTLPFISLYILLVTSSNGLCDVVTKIEVQQGVSINNVYLRLFDDIAPLTVTNFINYANGTTVNGGQYVDTFIHRVVPDFVIQGGGYQFDPTSGAFNNLLKDDPILSEFNLSNLRGTVAMALIGSDENSGSNEWFINLADNSSVLDDINTVGNPPFTVFGNVIGNGMTVVDEIADWQIYDISGVNLAFSEMPLVNYVSGSIEKENLVAINNVNEVFTITSDIDFGIVLENTLTSSDIVIENTYSSNLVMGDIGLIDNLSTPFLIVNDDCANKILAPSEQCVLTVEIMQQDAGTFENSFSDSFNIEFSSLLEISGAPLNLSFSVDGTVESIEQSIAVSISELDYGEVEIYDPANGNDGLNFNVGVRNHGRTDLNVTSVVLSGPDVSHYELDDRCSINSPLSLTDTCIIGLTFKPLSDGEFPVTLVINSDDPDTSEVVIPITGTGSLDGDGVSAIIENASPNDGDGNNDDILDSAQANVASIRAVDGSYITYITNDGVKFKNVVALDVMQDPVPPDWINFSKGVTSFAMEVPFSPAGVDAEIGIILPAGKVLETVYIYGPTQDDLNMHWYDYFFDGQTGVVVIGDVAIQSASGVTIHRSAAKLFIKDGGRGDSDLATNGAISVLIAPVFTENTASSGAVTLYSLIMLLISILFGRYFLAQYNPDYTP